MNKIGIFVFIFFISALLNISHAASEHYWLPKMTSISFDDNPEKTAPLFSVGLLYGYVLPANIAVELEGNYGVFGGHYSTSSQKGEFNSWSLGSFLVYRIPFSTTRYVKLKSGALYQNVENENKTTNTTVETQETELVFGIGAGRVTHGGTTLELEYTRTQGSSHNFALAIYFPF